MGLFGNSQTKEFKDKFVDMWNLLADYSYGHSTLSRETSIRKIEVHFQELKEIAKRYPNPFNVHFNMHTQNSGMFGEKTSVAKGIAIIQLALEAVSQGYPLSVQVQNSAIAQAEGFCNSFQGQQKIKTIINS